MPREFVSNKWVKVPQLAIFKGAPPQYCLWTKVRIPADEFARDCPDRQESRDWFQAESAKKYAKTRAGIDAAARKAARARKLAAKAAKKKPVGVITDQESWDKGLSKLRPVGKSKTPHFPS
jgi:hypothetical protein